MNSFFRTCAIFTSLSPLVIGTAWAQVNIPSSAQPGRTDTYRSIQKRPSVSSEPLLQIQDENGKGVKALKGGASFTLRNVVIEDGTVFPESELAAIYQSYIGSSVNLSTLNEIAAKITAHYRNAGYILSRAVVVPQHIKSGVLKIRIVEGYIDQVVFQGNKVESKLLNGYAAEIRAARPLSSAMLERYLLLMEDLSGVKARATLRPSAGQPGASDVIVTIEEKPVNVSLTTDNRGTRFLGQNQASATVSVNNMLGGLYEKTQIRGLNSFGSRDDLKELHYGEIRHEQQLDHEGTKLALSGSYTRSNAGHTLKASKVIGRDEFLSADVSHPFIRSRETNLYGNVQYDHRRTTVETLNVPFYEDRLNVFRAGAAYDFVDNFSGVNRVDAKVSKGFGWDDNSPTGVRSQARGRPSFVKGNAEASRLQPVYGPVSLLVAGMGQLSAHSLLSSEKFGVGGANYGSAYDASEITGDSGLAGRTELQFSGQDDIPYVPAYQLYGFYDVGAVWTRSPAAGQGKRESLASTGVGARFNTDADVSGGVELSLPLTQRVAANGGEGHSPRVFFNLGYHY